jgi:hypothetical protein
MAEEEVAGAEGAGVGRWGSPSIWIWPQKGDAEEINAGSLAAMGSPGVEEWSGRGDVGMREDGLGALLLRCFRIASVAHRSQAFLFFSTVTCLRYSTMDRTCTLVSPSPL